jgi:ribosomal protein L40E
MASETGKLTCTKCGADLRPGASFCSKCGSRYARDFAATRAGILSQEDDEKPAASPNVSDAWLKADIVSAAPAALGEPEMQETPTDAPEAEMPGEAIDVEAAEEEPDEQETQLSMPAFERKSNVIPIRENLPAPDLEAPESEAENVPEPAPSVRAKSFSEKVQTAAPANTAAMRSRPKLQREKIEMVWEQPEAGVNVWFIIGSIVVIAAVFIVIMLAWMNR